MIDANLMGQLWPLLALGAFVLATTVLSVLAAHQRYALRMHDTILKSRIKRFKYLAQLAEAEAEEIIEV